MEEKDDGIPEAIPESLPDRIKQLEKEQEALYKKYHVEPRIVEHFPIYRLLPDEVKLAIAVLVKHGITYKMTYTERRNDAD